MVRKGRNALDLGKFALEWRFSHIGRNTLYSTEVGDLLNITEVGDLLNIVEVSDGLIWLYLFIYI